jgi:hypothetical protein
MTNSERMSFLYENFTPEITPRSQEILVGRTFNFLPKNVKMKLESKYADVEYAEGGQVASFEKKIKDAMKEENKWHFINEEFDGKAVQLKMFVGKKEVDVQIFRINGRAAGMPKNYAGKRETLKMIMDNFQTKMESSSVMAKGGYMEGGGEVSNMSEKEFLNKYYGANVFTEDVSKYFDIKKLSSSNDEKVAKFIEELKKDGYTIKKKSYSDFTSVMGVKKKMSESESMEGGGYVAVSEKDGYWTIISKPTTKEKAEEVIKMGGLPRGEVGKVVTVAQAKSHKKLIGEEYLAQGGKLAKGGKIETFAIYPQRKVNIVKPAGEDLYTTEFKSSFRVVATLSEAEEQAQKFVRENESMFPFVEVKKIHPSGNPLKNKTISRVEKDKITKL